MRLPNYLHTAPIKLPEQWRNNEYVVNGYRFVPIDQWKDLIRVTFLRMHNETRASPHSRLALRRLTLSKVNIHTHLIPLRQSNVVSSPPITHLVRLVISVAPIASAYFSGTNQGDIPTFVFSIFADICLLTSVVWHIFAGCAHPDVMEFAARVDYVGIGCLFNLPGHVLPILIPNYSRAHQRKHRHRRVLWVYLPPCRSWSLSRDICPHWRCRQHTTLYAVVQPTEAQSLCRSARTLYYATNSVTD